MTLLKITYEPEQFACSTSMPISDVDAVSTAIQGSLTANRKSEFNNRVLASTLVLRSKIDYEATEDYSVKVLDNLKDKYIVLRSQKLRSSINPDKSLDSIVNMKPEDAGLPQPRLVLFPIENVTGGWRIPKSPDKGMYNERNYCYMLASLQALFHTPAFVNWLLDEGLRGGACPSCTGHKCLICEVVAIVKHNMGPKNIISPRSLIHKIGIICPHMKSGSQEDAHEFLKGLLEALGNIFLSRYKHLYRETLDNDRYSKETTPIHQIFGGYFRSEVMCQVCKGVSTTYQHFQDLLLDIRTANSLYDALDKYFCRESLEGASYKCQSCKKNVSATVKLCIEKPPHVLCITYKRFVGMAGKFNKHVGFPEQLEMTKHLSARCVSLRQKPLKYRLVSLVTHMGHSMSTGHYTAVGLTPSGKYLHFNDHSVSAINIKDVLRQNTYILFYEMLGTSGTQKGKPSAISASNRMLKPSSKPTPIPDGLRNAVNGHGKSNGTVNCSNIVKPIHSSPLKPVTASGTSTTTVTTNQLNHTGTPLPAAKERAKVAFELQPRLVVHIKNGKVYRPPPAANGVAPKSSSLVPYESGDSSASDAEQQGLDMPSLLCTPSENIPRADIGPNSSVTQLKQKKSPVKEQLYDTVLKVACNSGSASASDEQERVVVTCTANDQKTLKSSEVIGNGGLQHLGCTLPDKSPSTSLPDSTENTDPKIDNDKSGKSGCSTSKQDIDASSSCQLNFSLALGRGKISSGWQVTEVSLHSPSAHSESSGSSTTEWSVSVSNNTGVFSASTKINRLCSTDDVIAGEKCLSSTNIDIEVNNDTLTKKSRTLSSVDILPIQSFDISSSGDKDTVMSQSQDNSSINTVMSTASNKAEANAIDKSKMRDSCSKTSKHQKNSKDSDEEVTYEWVEKPAHSHTPKHSKVRNGVKLNGDGRSSLPSMEDLHGNREAYISSYLKKGNHRGYGGAVSSWSGDKSHIDKSVEQDARESKKRSYDEYEEDLDRGRSKRVKHYRPFPKYRGNPFQEYQEGDYRNGWRRPYDNRDHRHYGYHKKTYKYHDKTHYHSRKRNWNH